MAAAISVELKQTKQDRQLLRGGKPYITCGVAGNASLEQLAAMNANSIRQ